MICQGECTLKFQTLPCFRGCLVTIFRPSVGILWVSWDLESCLLSLMCLVKGVFPLGLLVLWMWISPLFPDSPFLQGRPTARVSPTPAYPMLQCDLAPTGNQNITTASLDSKHWLFKILFQTEFFQSRPWNKVLGASHLFGRWLRETQWEAREKSHDKID